MIIIIIIIIIFSFNTQTDRTQNDWYKQYERMIAVITGVKFNCQQPCRVPNHVIHLTMPLPSKWRTSQPTGIPQVCVFNGGSELCLPAPTHQMFPTTLRVPKYVCSIGWKAWDRPTAPALIGSPSNWKLTSVSCISVWNNPETKRPRTKWRLYIMLKRPI